MKRTPPSLAQRTVAALAAITVLTTPLTSWEGTEYKVYLDGGKVPTVCNGHTGKDVRMGQDARTWQQCMALLAKDSKVHALNVARCMTIIAPPKTTAAFESLDFRSGQFCTSTMVRLANAGDLAGACKQFSRWVYDKQDRHWPKPVPGIVKRAAEEQALCEGGLTDANSQ